MSAKQAAPPSYAQATGSSTTSAPHSSNLEVPGGKNGIPANRRRSMEDEQRPLPAGWVRQWDSKEQHQFFVDTKADPPRSIWHHPYDDPDFLKTLSSESRERIQEEERQVKDAHHLDTTDDEAQLPPRPAKSGKAPQDKGKTSFGEKLKSKLSGMSKEERDAERRKRAEDEQRYYEAHMRFRSAMQQAQATGQPVFFAKDRDGKEIYIEPPQSQGMYGGGYGGGYGNYGGSGAYGYNPYASGPYQNPNARFIRPSYPYGGRPYGYGSGMGLPIAGGLMGGLLLGGLLF